MGRGNASKLLLRVLGAVCAGLGFVAIRSCCRRCKKARKAQKEAKARKRGFSNATSSPGLGGGVFGSPSPVAVSTALALASNGASIGSITEPTAQKCALFNIITSIMVIPAPFGAISVSLMDASIIFHLSSEVKILMRQLDELDMVREWPGEGDNLLWKAHSVNNAMKLVIARSPGLVTPAVAMQVVTLGCCLRSLLHQREIAARRQAEAKLVEIEEEFEVSQPHVSTTPASLGPVLGRSVSDASSSGTPGGGTPMSARGSVLGAFGVANGLQKPYDKSPLGDASRQGDATAVEAPGSEAGRFRLNPFAAPFVPAPKPAPVGRRHRHRRRSACYKPIVTDGTAPPPPPPPPRYSQ